jgi:hypothetical protein
MRMTLWQEILFVWIGMTIAPKLVIIPVWHLMWRALGDTKRQDEIDAEWLASLNGGNGGTGVDRHPRERRPWTRGPKRGPRGGGGAGARLIERRPQSVTARARVSRHASRAR